MSLTFEINAPPPPMDIGVDVKSVCVFEKGPEPIKPKIHKNGKTTYIHAEDQASLYSVHRHFVILIALRDNGLAKEK
jgi:hypothetical protein